MLKTLMTLGRALVVVTAIAFVPAAAKAQSPAAAGPSVGSFDGYRAMAITAGVVGGAVVGTVVTDGIVLPVLGYAGGGMGGGMANVAAGLISATGTVFGAVSGALYADNWYTGR